MVLQVLETPAFLEVPIAGARVSRCKVDHAFSLEWLDLDDPVELRIEQPFELLIDDATLQLDPEMPRGLGPALGLFGLEVSEIRATHDGDLTIRFTEGPRLRVPSGESYEAWQLASDAGALIVSMPGGGLATWSARTDSRS